jgi:F-type H+-transporting ATPase subunit a
LIANLALIEQLSQEEIRERILHTWESAEHSWVVPLHLGPIDVSLNKAVWFLFLGVAITFLILFVGSRMLKNRPGAYQVIVEEIYGFGRNNLGGQVGEEGRKWFPYTLSLFVFLLVLNIIGLFPNSYPVTSNISFTLVLAILTFLLTQYEGFRRNGVGPYLKSFVPPGLPWKPIMVPFMWFVEFLQEFTKPLTLALRLYANILAGHLIIFVFLSFILYFGAFMAVISVPAAVIFFAFEIFVAILQAYIFAILTQVYIELAMFREDH